MYVHYTYCNVNVTNGQECKVSTLQGNFHGMFPLLLFKLTSHCLTVSATALRSSLIKRILKEVCNVHWIFYTNRYLILNSFIKLHVFFAPQLILKKNYFLWHNVPRLWISKNVNFSFLLHVLVLKFIIGKGKIASFICKHSIKDTQPFFKTEASNYHPPIKSTFSLRKYLIHSLKWMSWDIEAYQYHHWHYGKNSVKLPSTC